MHIIFGDAVETISDNFIVLELESFLVPGVEKPVTAYCVVEKIPLADFDKLDALKQAHQELIKYYRQQYWTYCEHAIQGLTGKWNGELDSFYATLLQRVLEFKITPPPPDWNGVVVRD